MTSINFNMMKTMRASFGNSSFKSTATSKGSSPIARASNRHSIGGMVARPTILPEIQRENKFP
jgi:hypothetical protein